MIYLITGGYAGAILDILASTEKSNPTADDIFEATWKAVQQGDHGNSLVLAWKKLPSSAISQVKQILLLKQLDPNDKKSLDLLFVSGIISYHEIFGKRFARLNSWYVELLLRDRAANLGLDGADWLITRFDQFTPRIKTFNIEAYEIINDIENQVRNYAVARLCEQSTGNDHLLEGKVLRKNKFHESYPEDDAYERAKEWQQRSQQHGVGVNINPLIAFTSIGDLVQLLTELSVTDELLWKEIVKAIEKTTSIRDAVMHNQVINEKSLEKLYDLQAKILKALNR
jgi:hypothetical protein